MAAKGERREDWWGVRCQRCDAGFIAESWDARHSDYDGEDIHAACCESQGPCSEPDGWERLEHLSIAQWAGA
jgi:hypothetical protein